MTFIREGRKRSGEMFRGGRYEWKTCLFCDRYGAYRSRYVVATCRARFIVGPMSGEGYNAEPGGFEDYNDMCERPFRKSLFEERAFSGRTVGS